jgi:hypothetical protein
MLILVTVFGFINWMQEHLFHLKPDRTSSRFETEFGLTSGQCRPNKETETELIGAGRPLVHTGMC